MYKKCKTDFFFKNEELLKRMELEKEGEEGGSVS
jgi:hypothetical protein